VAEHQAAHSPPTGEGTPEEDQATDGNDPGEAPPPDNSLPVDSDVPEQSPAAARRRAHHVLRDRWDILLVIAAGGALGSLARWGLTTAVPYAHGTFAWATAIENVTGAFVLGALMVFILDVWPTTRYVRPFLGVGVLGGYTTFSTYMLDTRMMLVGGEVPAAFAYLFGTLLAGLVAVWIGVLTARAWVAAAERRHRRRRTESYTELDPAYAEPHHHPSHEPPARSNE
jgi:CrcB protein